MYRCIDSHICSAFALAVAVWAVPATPAHAQMQRPFPADALRGTITVLQPPEIQLNGQAQRLSPGSRIRNENNLLEMSGALINRKLIVNYNLDNLGLVKDVWILTEAERAKRPWPTTPRQAQEWIFDPQTQTWSRP
ncbi:hypothetical protein BH09PSE5_BH09PSE5_42260 [soil metagenome]